MTGEGVGDDYDDGDNDDDGGGGDDDDKPRMPALMAHASRISKWHGCRQQPPVVHRCSNMSDHLCTTARCS